LSAVAERYAAALADVAVERKNSETIKGNLAAFVEAFSSIADLRNALESPALNAEVKRKVIAEVAGKMGLDVAVRKSSPKWRRHFFLSSMSDSESSMRK
jgi:F0F1-type ATP synthase delta subunit